MTTKLWKELNDHQSEQMIGGTTTNWSFSSTYNAVSEKRIDFASYDDKTYKSVVGLGWADYSYEEIRSDGTIYSYATGVPGSGQSPVRKKASAFSFPDSIV